MDLLKTHLPSLFVACPTLDTIKAHIESCLAPRPNSDIIKEETGISTAPTKTKFLQNENDMGNLLVRALTELLRQADDQLCGLVIVVSEDDETVLL